MIKVPKKRLDDSQEWLLTNALGTYASGTIQDHLTRKYHGLLIVNNRVLVSRTEEIILCNKKEYKLSETYYKDFTPQNKNQISFEQNPLPTLTYKYDQCTITKSIALATHHNTVVIKYTIVTKEPFTCIFRPLLTHRNYHEVKQPFILEQKKKDKRVKVNGIRMTISEGRYAIDPHIYQNVYYPEEEKRGYEAYDHVFNPGYFIYEGRGTATIYITYTTEKEFMNPVQVFHEELKIRNKRYEGKTRLLKLLNNAAGDFITPFGIKAGYPWFDYYGRDTCIALVGLLLVRKDFAKARTILKQLSEKRKNGLIPNVINEKGSAYNSVDSSLWFIYAIYKYCEYTQDYHFVKTELWNTLEEIMTWYKKGTDFEIKMGSDGLISAGNKNTQLTWMDAQSHGITFTPRDGKAVEVNALWYNAVCSMEFLAKKFNKDYKSYGILAEMVKFHFLETFWNGEYLNDTDTDAAIRPNQLFAISLPFSLLDEEKARKVLKVVLDELVTPMGVRSLNPKHPNFHAIYEGDQYLRDAAYHNGTVWTWLVGPLMTAYIRLNNHSKTSKQQMYNTFCKVMEAHMLKEGCLGQISEIADGKEPFTPRGAYAQAWSVAELLRVLHEDIGLI